MYNSIFLTNQELNNRCEETDIADQRSYKKLLFPDICKQKRPILEALDVFFFQKNKITSQFLCVKI